MAAMHDRHARASPARSGSGRHAAPSSPRGTRCRRACTTIPSRRSYRRDRCRCLRRSASPRERRPSDRPAASTSAATASPRSGCRGARMVRSRVPPARKLRWAAMTAASSPGCVLAATSIGRPPICCRITCERRGVGRRRRHVELQVAADDDAIRAERAQALRVGRRLRQKKIGAAEHGARERRERCARSGTSAPTCAH